MVPTLLVGLGAWAFNAIRDPGDDPALPMKNSLGDASALSASGQGSDAEAAVDDCRTLWEADVDAVTAASATLEQWRAHINAQVSFNQGAINGTQAKEQWAASRVGAPEKSQAYEQADATYRQAAEGGNGAQARRCEVPDGEVDDEVAAQIQVCAAALDAHRPVLEAARPAYADWKQHQGDMAALAAGQMTRIAELTSWETLWRRGETNLAAYDERVAQAAGATCPLAQG